MARMMKATGGTAGCVQWTTTGQGTTVAGTGTGTLGGTGDDVGRTGLNALQASESRGRKNFQLAV